MSEFGDAVKKLNAKLETFRRNGLSGTWEYQELLAKIATAAGDNLSIAADGRARISGRGMPLSNKAAIMRASKTTLTVNKTIDRLKQSYADYYGVDAKNVTRAQAKQFAAVEDEIHSFIMANKDDIYNVEYFNKMIKSGKPLTKTQWNELRHFKESSYYQTHVKRMEQTKAIEGKEITSDIDFIMSRLETMYQQQAILIESGGLNAAREVNRKIKDAQRKLDSAIKKRDTLGRRRNK